MTEMRVECYSGYRADERPLRFVFHGHEYEVQDLDGQWYSPDATYFRVRAQDGNYYVLRHDIGQDSWTLDGFRAVRHDRDLSPLCRLSDSDLNTQMGVISCNCAEWWALVVA